MFSSVYNPQASVDRINNYIAELEKMKAQIPPMPMPNQPSINQTFQLASSGSGMRYANSLEEVNKELTIGDVPFFSKDMSVLWVKKATGETKAYELREIIEKDEKDLKIEYLMAQIEQMKKERDYEPNANVDEPITTTIKDEEPTGVSTISKSNKKSK